MMTMDDIAAALRQGVNRGILSEIAADLGLSRPTVSNAIRRGDPAVLNAAARKVEERSRAREQALERVQSALTGAGGGPTS